MNRSTFACLPVERSSRQRTLYPSLSMVSQRFDPIKPAPPVTRKRESFGKDSCLYDIGNILVIKKEIARNEVSLGKYKSLDLSNHKTSKQFYTLVNIFVVQHN